MRDQASLRFPDFTDEESGPRAELVDPERTVAFMLAGNAHVTFQSRRTGNRFTYRIFKGDKPGRHLVGVLTGAQTTDVPTPISGVSTTGESTRRARTAVSMRTPCPPS